MHQTYNNLESKLHNKPTSSPQENPTNPTKKYSLEDLKSEQDALKRLCQFHSNNIDNLQFQIQNQMKIYSSVAKGREAREAVKGIELALHSQSSTLQKQSKQI